MALTWVTTQTTAQEINSTTTQLNAKITKIDTTRHQLELHSNVTGGTVICDTSAQITALKQFLIDAGY